MVKIQTTSVNAHVSEEQCREASITRYMTVAKYISLSVKINTTSHSNMVVVGRIDPDGSCQGGKYMYLGQMRKGMVVNREYSLTVSEYVATFDGITEAMLTNGYTMCDIDAGGCYTGKSTLIYGQRKHTCQLVLLKSILFEEIVRKQAIVFDRTTFRASNATLYDKITEKQTPIVLMSKDEHDMVRLLRKNITYKCNNAVYLTNYEYLYVSKERIEEATDSLKPENIRLSNYFNNKMDYLFHYQLSNIESVYRVVVSNDCNIRRDLLLTKLAFVMANPDIAMPLLSWERGIFGRVVGEVLYTFRCKAVQVRVREAGECINEMPVLLGNEELYLEPVSRVLTRMSTKIPCSKILIAKFQVNDHFWVSSPLGHPTTIPETMQLPINNMTLSFKKFDDLAKSGIYSSKDIEHARKYALFPRIRGKVLTEIVFTASSGYEGNRDYDLLLSADHFAKATQHYLDKIWGKFQIFGQFFSGLIGIYCIITCVRAMLQQVLSTYHLYNLFGLSWKLLFSIFPFFSKIVVFSKTRKDIRSMKSSIEALKPRQGDIEPLIKEQPSTSITELQQIRSYMINAGASTLPYINILMNTIPIKAIVDTGSNITILDSLIWGNKRLSTTKLRPASGITGHELNILGNAIVELGILDQKITIEVRIMKACPFQCVLGVDSLDQLKNVWYNCQSRKLELALEVPTQPRPLMDEKEQAALYLKEAWEVDFWSETIYPIEVQVSDESNIIFEPSAQLVEKYNLVGATTVCKPVAGKIPIRLLNLSHFPVVLPMGLNIGIIASVLSEPKPSDRNKLMIEPDWFEHAEFTSKEKLELLALIRKYSIVFAASEYDLGKTPLVKHTIPLTDEKPIAQRPYRVPHALREEYARQIKGMLENKIIRPSSSPWASPVVLIRKKGGAMRFCVDYRRLNAITRKDTYPLPRIDDMLDRLNNAKYFSVLDLQSGFWQIDVAEEDKEKTAFTTGEGLYEFNVLPFGLTGSPPTFQRCMNFVLMDATHAMVYIDDVIIYSKTFKEHLNDLECVFQKLLSGGLKVKPSKCQWVRKEVTFLGHVVTASGIKPDPRNLEKVAECVAPTNLKELQRFLGLTGYYRRFILNYSGLAAPLIKLLKRDSKYLWNIAASEAFLALKNKLVTPPILRFPDFNKDFVLMTDASNYAVGAVLGQKDEEGRDYVIAYASRSLKVHEKNYAVVEKEALAIVFAVKYFRHYILNKKILILSDQRSLQWLMTHKDSSSRLIRWALYLQEFDIEISYRK